MIRLGTLTESLVVLLVLAWAANTGATAGPLVVAPAGSKGARVLFWLESSLKRVYPASKPGSRALAVLAPRNGQVSFQACLRNERTGQLHAECAVTGPQDLKIQVRRVGYVPMRFCTTDVPAAEMEGLAEGHIPGFVPDPLFPDQVADVSPGESMSFWITVRVPADAKPGKHELQVKWSFDNGTQHAELPATVEVSPFTVKSRRDFPVIHWWRAECIWDWYKTGMFEDERWWTITRRYLEDMVAHGTNVIGVPIFFMRRETFARPAQLLKVSEPEPGTYAFDFSDVSRFVKMAKGCGAEYYEWSHLWIYWGVVNPIRIYTWKDGKAVMLWPPDTDGHGPIYHNFLRQFLPQFHDFLIKEGILEQSFFHLSDEPGGEHIANYKRARGFLREVAPWMKVMDALSDVQYGKQGLTDIPIPVISAAQGYIDAKIPHWVYFCCGPRGSYLQRLLDTPLAKIRMSGWLFYRLGAKGFLHWGYNYWHAMEQERLINPFETAVNEAWPGIPPGDPFEVYPGADGPMDSIRWEVFAESLQDYAILQTVGIRPNDPMLVEIKSYADFPKRAKWVEKALERVLKCSAPP